MLPKFHVQVPGPVGNEAISPRTQILCTVCPNLSHAWLIPSLCPSYLLDGDGVAQEKWYARKRILVRFGVLDLLIFAGNSFVA